MKIVQVTLVVDGGWGSGPLVSYAPVCMYVCMHVYLNSVFYIA